MKNDINQIFNSSLGIINNDVMSFADQIKTQISSFTSGSVLDSAFVFPTSFNNSDIWKNQISELNKITSNIQLENDLLKTGFEFKTASSQIGTAFFQETRIIDARVMREKTLLAIKKLEEERTKYFEQDCSIDEY